MSAEAFCRLLYVLFFILSCQALKGLAYRAVVYPRLFEGRDENTKVLKINEEITLNLHPSSILREDFFVRKYREGVPEYKYFDVQALQQDLYHDAKQLAAVAVSEEEGTLRVEGVVGPNLKIRPIEASERSLYGDQAHIVDSIEDSKPDSSYGKIVEDRMIISERDTSGRVGYNPSKFDVEIIYPEVLIRCDSVFFAGFENKAGMIKYVVIMFSVVVLRYSTITLPRIEPILRGIEISNKTEEDEYYKYLGDGIDAIPSLYNAKEYVVARRELYAEFDLVYFLTAYDMIVPGDDGWDRGYRGFAFVGSACLDTREKLGEDTPNSFIGIRTMAHEMAHTLGCDHDQSTIDGHLPGYVANSTYCPWDDGYLMSYVIKDRRSMQFSECCAYDMRRYSWMYGAECLHVKSARKIAAILKKIYKLPGEFTKKDKQCQLTYPFFKDTRYMKESTSEDCMIYCSVPKNYQRGNHPGWVTELFDGSRCGQNRKRICLNGECVERSKLPSRKSEK
uniref:Putative tick salivary metalloprotease n=1 Tax=Rhipicephalus pulchellus TaxID=72859 RepID=L7LT56_RHIPC